MSSIKKERVVEGVRNSINIFLSKNSDRLGFCHVQEIILANDLRSAKVYIEFLESNNIKKKLGFINQGRSDILKEYNKQYSSKLFPSISFFSFNHEYII